MHLTTLRTARVGGHPCARHRPRRLIPLLLLAWPGWADEDPWHGTHSHSDGGLIEEVVTTATKKSAAERAQDVAIAMTVLGGEALAERHVTDLQDLSLAVPNVALDGVGTAKGIANFSIRGQGIAGSIPSIDPTVGTFVDGVYLGVNYGVIVDMLDLEAIEILRGPQGLLFGRNVTGGAVLLRSRRPSGESSAQGTLRAETGTEWRLTGSVERPLVEDVLDIRVSGSYRDDAGWFDNQGPGRDAVGAETTWVVRPVVTWTPTDDLEVTVIHERGDTAADGPATQNRLRLRGFDLALDETGYADVAWRHLIVEARRDVADGRGQITNVFGWREVQHESLTDTDSTPLPLFHYFGDTGQEQISNELRYARAFQGGQEVTVGAYFFSQEIRHRERRLFRDTWGSLFGGDQDHTTVGVFVNAEFDLGPDWVLTAGARYTLEEKDVRVATSGQPACFGPTRRCPVEFEDGDAWRNVTPKVGVQRWLGEHAQVYAHYTKGFRSGGYNLRNTAPNVPPGPFHEEAQDSFEAGLKSELADGYVRLNLAAFHNQIRGMQRQVLSFDPVLGGVQITANTADATIQGVEADVVAALGSSGTLSAFVGYTDGRYDRVRYDLTGDGTNVGDEKLKLPRLARLTWGVEATYARPVGTRGHLALRAALTHRDPSAFSDDNTAMLNGGEMLDTSICFSPNDALEFTLYGRNLLNERLWVADVDLGAVFGSTFSPLREGRVVGLEVRAFR